MIAFILVSWAEENAQLLSQRKLAVDMCFEAADERLQVKSSCNHFGWLCYVCTYVSMSVRTRVHAYLFKINSPVSGSGPTSAVYDTTNCACVHRQLDA